MADEKPAPATLPTGVTSWCQVTDGDDDDPVGTGDHCALALAGPNFDSVTITTLSGRASLGGGGTWGSTADQHRTTFAIVEPVAAAVVDAGINCTDQKVATATTTGGIITGVQLTRLDNGATDPASACQGLPYTLSSDAAGATFHKPSVDSQKTAQFTVTITRTYPSGKVPFPVPAPRVDWEDGQPALDLGLCPGGLVSAARDANGVPTSVDYSKVGADQSPKPDVQFACVYAEETPYDNATGTMKVVDHIYFTGDIKFPSA